MMRELSLHKSLKAGENFSLLDIIAAEKEDFPTCDASPKLKIHQARRSIEIDQDVVNAIRLRFGAMPLGRAIRKMLGLKPKVAQNAYQEEEDELIKKYYSQHGAKALAQVLDRSEDCIRERASDLGVKRIWQYSRISQIQIDRIVKRNPLSSVQELVSLATLRYPLNEVRAKIMVGNTFKRLEGVNNE